MFAAHSKSKYYIGQKSLCIDAIDIENPFTSPNPALNKMFSLGLAKRRCFHISLENILLSNSQRPTIGKNAQTFNGVNL